MISSASEAEIVLPRFKQQGNRRLVIQDRTSGPRKLAKPLQSINQSDTSKKSEPIHHRGWRHTSPQGTRKRCSNVAWSLSAKSIPISARTAL
jgi:hypothetical protein